MRRAPRQKRIKALLNCLVVSQSHYFSPQNLLSDEQLSRSSPLQIALRRHRLQFFTGEGVFAKSGLDAGSRLLLESLCDALGESLGKSLSAAPDALPNGARFCDLGCGWGVVGAVVATEFPELRICACDVNPRAVQLARRNWQLNEISGGALWCGDGLDAVRGDFLDIIACNPPIRAGNAVIDKLFGDAHRTLKPGGALWAVVRTAQGAKSWQGKLAARFGACDLVAMRAGYRVLKAVAESGC